MKISVSLGSAGITCSIVKVLAALCFFIWTFISAYALYLLFALDPEFEAKDFYSTLGSLMAGAGTLVLAFLSIKAFGDWRSQEAVKK